MSPRVGVVALQGAFAAHLAVLDRLGVDGVALRRPGDLVGCDALIWPGGESTTMSKLAVSSGMFDTVAERLAEGLPALGTCAGLIMFASTIDDGRSDQRCFGAIDAEIRRNAYGRQIDSFHVDLDVRGLDAPFFATFIRAPRVERVGAGVEVLASLDGHAVALRDGAVMATTFHPELGGDDRFHRLFLERA
ncbi:MAG: pyridoxal 5'-phosphate synthase glutaminase subunit PdxT [Microthrixaceae bacterium]